MLITKPSKYHQNGFSLIELLVAVVVLSIGMLGLAGLQATGLQHNHSANYRSTATVLAYSIVDSMRANRVGAGDGLYNITLAESAPTGTAIYDQDLSIWLGELAARLPSGDGAVDSVTNVVGTVQLITVTVTVQWDDRRGGGSETQQFTLNSQILDRT